MAVIENGVHVGLVFRDNYGVWVCFCLGLDFVYLRCSFPMCVGLMFYEMFCGAFEV